MTRKPNKGSNVLSDFSGAIATVVALSREPITDDNKALYISKIVSGMAVLDILTSIFSTFLHTLGLNSVGLPLRYSSHYKYNIQNRIIYDIAFYAIECICAWRIYLGRGYISALFLFILSLIGALAFMTIDVMSFINVIVSGSDFDFPNFMLLFFFGTIIFALPFAYWGGFKACRYLAKSGYWKKSASL